MTWLALATLHTGHFAPNGLGEDRRDGAQIDTTTGALLARGTVMLETRMSPNGKPQRLFGFERDFPWRRSLSLQAIPGGGIALVLGQGKDVTHAALHWRGSGRADIVRITYAWDSVKGWGRLSLERPEESTVTSVPVPHPRPIAIEDLRDVFLGRGDRSFASDVMFVALSNEIEPIGPMPTLGPQTPVSTQFGVRAAGSLRRGDSVYTENYALVPVLHTISRTVPALGSFAPIRLRAPYFGLRRDIIAAPDQRLIIRGSDVEYLFGKEAVLVPARHLVNGYAATYEPCGPTITYTHLLLPGHESVLAAGTALESLYIGRLRRKSEDLEASMLAHKPRNSLPEHAKPLFPVLKSYEAITLADQRAA